MIRKLKTRFVVLIVITVAMGCATSPPPVATSAPKSYVVLMENADGMVGQIKVSSPKGEVLLNKPRSGVDLDSTAGTPYQVEANRINRDFGEAIAASPPLPVIFMLYFEAGGTVLTEESQALIPSILDAAKNHPATDVSVIGHTDTIGDSEANEKLGMMRAQAVAEIIQRVGLRVYELTIDSHGERNLLVDTPDNTAEPKNRRVEITVR
jgi:peptidoglycan-associated lipoprotein